MPDTVKSLLKNFARLAILCLYFVGFIYLMMAAIFNPIELNAKNPVFSTWRIVAWIAYICAGGAVYLTEAMWG